MINSTHSPIRIIVFDLGRVMIHIAGGWEEACRYAGVPYRPCLQTPEEQAGFFRLEDDVESNRLDFATFTVRLAAVLHDTYTPAEVGAIYMGVIQAEFPGIYELVDALHAAGLATACLSNTCGAHWAEFMKPARYPAICRLRYPCASHLFGVRKPGQVIYRKFEAATGFPPEAILFFDDKLENVTAATDCGWHAVQILPAQSSVAQMYAVLAEQGIVLT